MDIRRVRYSEVDFVLAIYQSCVTIHKKLGFNQWDDYYPNKKTILSDIQKGWLFGLFRDKKFLLAVISITKEEPIEYRSLKWQDNLPNYLIVHRLCVSELFLRKGYAQLLMLFAEELALKSNYKSIRLDTFSLNKGALAFYKKLNYNEIGKINFQKREDSNYTCFEKVL